MSPLDQFLLTPYKFCMVSNGKIFVTDGETWKEFIPGVSDPACVLDFTKVKPPKNLHKVTLYRSDEYAKFLQDFPELKHLEVKRPKDKNLFKALKKELGSTKASKKIKFSRKDFPTLYKL